MINKVRTLRERMFRLDYYAQAACISDVTVQPDGSSLVMFKSISYEDYYFSPQENAKWPMKVGNYYVIFNGNYHDCVVLTPTALMEEYVPLEDHPTVPTV